MFSRRLLAAAFGAAFLGVVATTSMQALSVSGNPTYLTFNRSVALPGVVLPAGSYIFELIMTESHANLVRVRSRDRHQVYLTAFTAMEKRPWNLDPTKMVTFGEAPRGMATPIEVWYPSQDANGRRFIYQ